MQKTFSFTGARKIVFGCGSFSGLVGQIRDLRARKPLIAMDGNLAKLGMRDKIMEMFDREGMKAVLYDRVLPEPPLEQADEGAKMALKGKCDIVIENFKPGTMEGWGLGWDELSELNPGLIMLRISGYGQTGPYRDQAGFGVIGEAMVACVIADHYLRQRGQMGEPPAWPFVRA